MAIAPGRLGVAILIGAYLVSTIVSAIQTEEAGIRASFGDQYHAYLESRATPVERSFSVSRAMKNKEYRDAGH